MRKPKTALMPAAMSEAPKVSRYEAIARGSSSVSQKRCHSMPIALSTRAASGKSTIALRKKVVKPTVRPKPGMTLGCRKRPVRALTTAPSADMGKPWMLAAGRADDDRRVRERAAEKAVEPSFDFRRIGNAENEHLAGERREFARELLRRVAHAKFRADVKAMDGLPFRARIEQSEHALVALALRTAGRQDIERQRFRRHVAEQARRDGERRATGRIVGPVNEDPLRRLAEYGQHEDFRRAIAEQPGDPRRRIRARRDHRDAGRRRSRPRRIAGQRCVQ